VSGALFTANTNLPGLVRIAIIKSTPFPGNGQIATISFAVNNGSAGLTSISARLIDAKGANLPVQTSIAAGLSSTPTTLINPPTANTPAQLTAGTTTSSTGTTILGTVTTPGDTQPKVEPKPAEPPSQPLPSEPAMVPDDAAALPREIVEEKPSPPVTYVEPKTISYGSVLDRFKMYVGDRTPAAMMALFEKPVMPELRQEPAIAASDGSTSVRMYVNLPKGSGSSPNFSLLGAKVVSVAHDEELGALVLEVLPKENSTQAAVTIMAEYSIVTVPLTIVPLAAEVSTQEAAFGDFLKDMGSKKPKFDLNHDGVHDYVDDYIYTGQYLIKKAAAGNKAKK
jgi:hypothetical protein